MESVNALRIHSVCLALENACITAESQLTGTALDEHSAEGGV